MACYGIDDGDMEATSTPSRHASDKHSLKNQTGSPVEP
jgi:hypothetical protein